MRNPLESTGVVLRRGKTEWQGAGTCFAFKSQHCFLTARHCVRGASASDLRLALYGGPSVSDHKGLDVTAVVEHPDADFAILFRPRDGSGVFDPFEGFEMQPDLGESIRSFGFPSETVDDRVGLIPRMLRGHVQRRFHFKSPRGYSYPALELSHAAPAGLSGSPVSTDRMQSHVVGLIAENLDSSTLLHEVTDTTVNGDRLVERIHAVVTYGIAVDLSAYSNWIKEKLRGYDA